MALVIRFAYLLAGALGGCAWSLGLITVALTVRRLWVSRVASVVALLGLAFVLGLNYPRYTAPGVAFGWLVGLVLVGLIRSAARRDDPPPPAPGGQLEPPRALPSGPGRRPGQQLERVSIRDVLGALRLR